MTNPLFGKKGGFGVILNLMEAQKTQTKNINKVLVTAISPYFLKRENVWFKKNINKILESRQTQSFWKNNTIYCQKNQNYNLSYFLRKLDEMGYEKVFKVREPGEFSQRGGVVDVFPINLKYAIRFDFLGNQIEAIEKLPQEIENEKKAKKLLKKKIKSQERFSGLKNLKPGNYLVHLDHGIAKFSGIQEFKERKYYVLNYAKGDKLYVPKGLERKLSRYVGFTAPKISRLGCLVWQKTKRKVKKEAKELAKELLNIYAVKETSERPPYSIDKEIQSHLSSTFPYQETPDQIQTLEDIKNDLEKKKPIDRIVCGDVGFGKTEIAVRTSAIAVTNNYQVALISPTTILANQHYNTFSSRLSKLPIKVEVLSRLQPNKKQNQIIKNLENGNIDILIGTHRLLSSDVNFKNLQLLIIDDEQKFGVKHKEKLRKQKPTLDVLSLSATPIPRTLYLSLSSIKDISTIQTAPEGRLPTKTKTLPYNKEIIEKAIQFEISRKGQVYYLHNRVETIKKVKQRLKQLVPEAKIGIIHGRMKKQNLIKTMNKFQNKEINVLVATTIIENGLDFPSVNTLIVEDSTKLGLSQSYQIQGRIGRAKTQSFAYFLYPRKKIKPLARKRLKVLKEAKELGSGYQIALQDLEMRGAGNILGKEQSGSINAVGLNLYCQILTEEIEKLKQ